MVAGSVRLPIPARRSTGRGLLALLALALLGACGDRAPDAPAERATSAYDQDGRLLRAGSPRGRPPNLVVVVLDTLRWDAVRGLGGDEGVMPFVASLAKQGVLFENATAPAPWTVPSITSLLTGLSPAVHGCVDDRSAQIRVPDSVTTFAEALRSGGGYQTAAFVGGAWTPSTDTAFQGFETFVPGFHLQGARSFLPGWYRKTDPNRPFFLLLHSFEVHEPYGARNHPWPPPIARESAADPVAALAPDAPAHEVTRRFFLDRAFHDALLSSDHIARYERVVVDYVTSGYRREPRPELARELLAEYREGARWVDGLLEKTVDQLKGWGLLENTLLVVTADHGEAFGEHGILMHGRQVYDELVRIPLVMAGPAPFGGGRVVRGSVGLIDVMPTFLDFAGMPAIDGTQARSFLDLAVADGPGRPIVSEELVTPPKTAGAQNALIQSVRTERWKFIATYDLVEGRVTEEAYDLEHDPGEREDLAGGTGRVSTTPFDPDFCDAVEEVRDRIWGAVDRTQSLVGSGYATGMARVLDERPPRTCLRPPAPPR